MSRKTSMSRALVADVVKRLMVVIETPAFDELVASVHSVDHELDDLDGLLERLANEPTTPKVSPPVATAPVDPACGTKPITIRIHNRVINAFKAEAARTGARYQTLMHRALADVADGFAL